MYNSQNKNEVNPIDTYINEAEMDDPRQCRGYPHNFNYMEVLKLKIFLDTEDDLIVVIESHMRNAFS